MIPADDIEALEGLVDGVERMTAIGVIAVGDGTEQQTGERAWAGARGDGRQQGAFGAVPVAHQGPVAQPALQRLEGRRLLAQFLARPVGRLPVTVRRHPADALVEGEIGLVLGQGGNEVAERRQHRQSAAPAVAVAGAEQGGLADDLGIAGAGRPEAEHGLGDDEADIVGHAVAEAPAPMAGFVGVAAIARHPDLAMANLHRAGGHVVRPQVEGGAASKIEARMVPVAGEDAVLDRAAVERKAKVGTTVIEGQDLARVIDDEERRAGAAEHQFALGLELVQGADADQAVRCLVHVPCFPVPSRRMFAIIAARGSRHGLVRIIWRLGDAAANDWRVSCRKCRENWSGRACA